MYTEREKYYSLQLNNEDGSRSREIYRTKFKDVADKWKKDSNWNSVVEKDEMIIFIESFEDVAVAEIEKKKKAALAKLTEADRKLLGLE